MPEPRRLSSAEPGTDDASFSESARSRQAPPTACRASESLVWPDQLKPSGVGWAPSPVAVTGWRLHTVFRSRISRLPLG